MRFKFLKFNFKVFFISLVCFLVLTAKVYALVVSGTTVALIMFAGKVYAISGRVVNGATSAASAVICKATAKEAEETIESFIFSINDNISKAESQAYGAATKEEAKKAMEKQAQLELLKQQYQALLSQVTDNKNLTVANISKKEIKDQGVGFVLGELGVSDEAQGKVGNWSLEQAVKLAGYEVSEAGSKVIELAWKLPQDVWQAGKNIFSGALLGNIELKEEDLTEEDKQFFQALKEGRATPLKAAISKAQWDFFVNVTAKEEFKKYLKGEQSRFNSLPLSIQQKYWSSTWLMSEQIDEIHALMKEARRTGDYAKAVSEIIKKYPDYADLFKALTKNTAGDVKDLLKAVNEAYKKELEKQKQEIEKAEKEAEEAKKQEEEKKKQDQEKSQSEKESLPTTAEEAVDEAKKLSPQQTKSSCMQFYDNMCRGLCSNEPEYFNMCYDTCMSANKGGCANLPD
jgi:hypothetical protein